MSILFERAPSVNEKMRESARLQSGDDGVGEFGGRGGAANVGCEALPFAVNTFERFVDAQSGGAFAEMLEHQHGAHEERGGIGQTVSGDVRRGAVNGLKHGDLIADVRAGNYAEAADKARGKIAHHVAVEVGQEEKVELLRIEHHLHAGVVHDQFLVLDGGMFLRDSADGLEKQPVAHLHDIGLVNGVDFLAPAASRVFKGESGDARGGALGDDLQAFHDAGNDFMLEAGVEVLGVFAHDDDVHVLITRLHAGEVLHRAKIGKQIEGLAQADVDARWALGDGGGHGAFASDAVAANGFDRPRFDALARFGRFFGAPFDDLPVDGDAGGVQDALRCGSYFGAGALPGDQRGLLFHRGIQLYVKRAGQGKPRGVSLQLRNSADAARPKFCYTWRGKFSARDFTSGE